MLVTNACEFACLSTHTMLIFDGDNCKNLLLYNYSGQCVFLHSNVENIVHIKYVTISLFRLNTYLISFHINFIPQFKAFHVNIIFNNVDEV